MEKGATAERQRGPDAVQPQHDPGVVRAARGPHLDHAPAGQQRGAHQQQDHRGAPPAAPRRDAGRHEQAGDGAAVDAGDVDVRHRETTPSSNEDQHAFHGNCSSVGWRTAQRIHDPAARQRCDNIGAAGSAFTEERHAGRQGQAARGVRGHPQQHGHHGVPAHQPTAQRQLQEHAAAQDQTRREERHRERYGREADAAVPVAVQRGRRGARLPGLDPVASGCGHSPRQPGAPRVGHRHVGQRLQSPGQGALRCPRQGDLGPARGDPQPQVQLGHGRVSLGGQPEVLG